MIFNEQYLKKIVGKTLSWDEPGRVYVFKRQGVLNEVFRKQVRIGDNWFSISDIKKLKNLKLNGELE